MNTAHRKPLPGTKLDYVDTREAVEAIQPGAYAKRPYTARVHAEKQERRSDPAQITATPETLNEPKRGQDVTRLPGPRRRTGFPACTREVYGSFA